MNRIPIRWKFDDGGRRREGHGTAAGDPVVRAVAIVSRRSYTEVFDEIESFRRYCDLRVGALPRWLQLYMRHQGWTWTPATFLGEGCTTHLRTDELPGGRIIVRISHGVAAVIDGCLHDVTDCSRNGRRCVYGWWTCTEVGTP
jgi:hypothetical protein